MAATIDREAIWTIQAAEQLEFDSRTRRSAELAERGRRSMPAGVPMAWMAGLYATLRHIQTPEAFDRVAALGAQLADGIETAAARHGLPWRAHRIGGR